MLGKLVHGAFAMRALSPISKVLHYNAMCPVFSVRTVSTSELVGETMKVSFRKKLENLDGFGVGSVDLVKDASSNIAYVALNNTAKHNAMTAKMMCDVDDVVYELSRWVEGQGVVIYGKGGTFCSGGDLNMVKQIMTPQMGKQMSLFMTKTLSKLYKLPLISVALVQGHALGGGAELTLATDFRIMAHDAKVGFIQGRMGVTTGWGGGSRLVKLTGPTRALHLLASGEKIGPEKAAAFGLCDLAMLPEESVDEDSALAMATRFIEQHTRQMDPKIVRAIKAMVAHCSESASMEEAANVERDVFYQTWGGRAHGRAVERVLVGSGGGAGGKT